MTTLLSSTGVGGSTSSTATVLLLDNFVDANGTSLAAHTISPTNVPAASWTLASGGAGADIQSDTVVANSGASDVIYLVNLGQSDVTQTVQGTWATADTQFNVWGRETATNSYWVCLYDGSNWNLYEVAAGVVTQRASTAYAMSNGHNFTAQVVYAGATITLSVDGTQLFSYASATFNQTATYFGFEMYRSGATPASSVNHFKVTQP